MKIKERIYNILALNQPPQEEIMQLLMDSRHHLDIVAYPR